MLLGIPARHGSRQTETNEQILTCTHKPAHRGKTPYELASSRDPSQNPDTPKLQAPASDMAGGVASELGARGGRLQVFSTGGSADLKVVRKT